MIETQLHKIERETARGSLDRWLRGSKLTDTFFFIPDERPVKVKWEYRFKRAYIHFLTEPDEVVLFIEYKCFDIKKFWTFEGTGIPFVQEFVDFIRDIE